MIGGLCLFLFGMSIMGEALERRAGSKLHGLLSKLTTGMIFLGFATMMYCMDAMTDAVSGLADVPQFRGLFLLLQNPILGVLATPSLAKPQREK